MKELLPFEKALRVIVGSVPSLSAERVSPIEAVGRVLASDVRAPEDLPRFPMSAMDGYIVPRRIYEAIERDGQATARVKGKIRAGSSSYTGPIGLSDVARIFTGGEVPRWAVSVVMQEQCERTGDSVTIRGPVKAAEHIRDAGGDVSCGCVVIDKGETIHPPHVALLSALGVDSVEVGRLPSIGLVVTGAEIAEGPDPEPGGIRDSNGPTIEAVAGLCGAGEFRRLWADDTRESIATAVSELLGEVDVLCVSGGVSVGDYDVVKEVLEDMGVRRVFWRVAQRPGKPLYFGLYGDRPVFGIPGNPASTLVTFLAHIWPALQSMQGSSSPFSRKDTILDEDAGKPTGFLVMLRGRLHADGVESRVVPVQGQESHMMLSFARSNCLILCPPQYAVVPRGTRVEVIPFPWA